MDIETKLDLRDFFAVKAMEAAMKVVPAPDSKDSSLTAYDNWARGEERLAAFCYKIADAMMEARRQNSEWLNNKTAL